MTLPFKPPFILKPLLNNLFQVVCGVLACCLFGCVAKSGADIRFKESTVVAAPVIAPDGVDDLNFSFVFVGDLHSSAHDLERVKSVLQEAQSYGDAFVIFLGDIVDKGEKDAIEAVRNQVSLYGFDQKVIYVLGNHDVFGDGWNAWKESIGPSHFELTVGNIQFFVLDSADGMVGEKQIEWLDTQLTKSQATHKIILSHYLPVIPGQRTYLKLANEVEAARLMKLVSRHKVHSWMGGHYHSFIQDQIEQVNYVVAGGGGGRKMAPIKENFFVRALVSGSTISYELNKF